jgi:hypothetical protein
MMARQRWLIGVLIGLAVAPAARAAGEPVTTPHTYCREPDLRIPDHDLDGVTDTIVLPAMPGVVVTNLEVSLLTSHTWVSDLRYELTHVDTGTSAKILDFWTVVCDPFDCCPGDDLDVVLADDHVSNPLFGCIDQQVPTLQGEFHPHPDPLSTFDGEELGGTWSLMVGDDASGDTGTLTGWCLYFETVGGGTGGGTTGGSPVPATGARGALALAAALLLLSVLFLKRHARRAS